MNKNQGYAASTAVDNEWHDCCEKIADCLIEPAANMLPNALIPPQIQRKKEVLSLALQLSSNEMVALLTEGVSELRQHPAPEAQAILESLRRGLEQAQPIDISQPPGTWKTISQVLQVDPSLWAWAEAVAMQWLQEEDFTRAASLFALAA